MFKALLSAGTGVDIFHHASTLLWRSEMLFLCVLSWIRLFYPSLHAFLFLSYDCTFSHYTVYICTLKPYTSLCCLFTKLYLISSCQLRKILTDAATQIAKSMGPTWGPPGSCWPQMGSMLAPWTLLSGKVWRHLGSRKMSGYQRVLHHVWYPLTLRVSSKLSHLMNHDECVRRQQASHGCGYCRLRANFSHRLDVFFCARTPYVV